MNLKIATAEEYFNNLEEPKKIDWERTGNPNMVSVEEEDLVTKILTCEASIYLLRRAPGGYGHLVDTMASMRRDFIDEFEGKYRKYESFNDFY